MYSVYDRVFTVQLKFSPQGCYLGQELTARTHHTGVIRKRIMPLMLSTSISPDLGPSQGDLILNTGGKDAGQSSVLRRVSERMADRVPVLMRRSCFLFHDNERYLFSFS